MASKITPELLAKAKQAKSAQELIALAKENGAELSAEEAQKLFDRIGDGTLTDEDLEKVSGGYPRPRGDITELEVGLYKKWRESHEN